MTTVNQKEYLKKYLSIGSDSKKHKKKKKKPVTSVKIIDDDIDVNLFNKAVEEDLMGATEDAPQVVGVIDDRPLQLRIDDYRKSDLWKPVGAPIDLNDNSKDSSPVRGRNGDFGDLSPPGNRDLSPPRKKNNRERTPTRKRRKNSDSSPVRVKIERTSDDDHSPVRRKPRDDDMSPPRRKRKDSVRNDGDSSPPRRKRKNSDDDDPRRKRRDSDRSRGGGSRNDRSRGDRSEVRSPKQRKSRFSDASPVRVKIERDENDDEGRMTKTLDGKKAGLQDARELVIENEKFKRREDELFKNMRPEVSGAHSKTIIRDKKTGKIRDLNREADDQREKQKETDARAEKYNQWGKGLKQVEAYTQRLEEDLHEMNKPLARYADDEDLERHLKEQEWAMDPMLAYIRKKKKKEIVKNNTPLKPQYEGEFMPNRYGIPPGYRWDGVDRSNGYEAKYITQINAQNADLEEAYKWSTEDM